MNADWLSEK